MQTPKLPRYDKDNQDNYSNNPVKKTGRARGIFRHLLVFAVLGGLFYRFLPLIVIFFVASNAGSIGSSLFGGGTIGGVGAQNSSFDSGSEGSVDSIISIDSTPLIRAAAAGNYEKVEKLLEENIPVDGRDSEERTALIAAAYNERNEICRLLITAGANPYMQDRNGFNALDFAASRGLVDTVKLILKESKSPDQRHHAEYAMLMQAAFAANAGLLPAGKDDFYSANRISIEDKSPLHIAASNDSEDLIKAMIKRGAKVNIENSSGQTPLHWAAWNNKVNAISLLLKNSAKIDITDNDGTTPLMFAAKNNSKEAVILLLENGANKNKRNKKGKNAAYIATSSGFIEIADILQK